MNAGRHDPALAAAERQLLLTTARALRDLLNACGSLPWQQVQQRVSQLNADLAPFDDKPPPPVAIAAGEADPRPR